MTINSTVTGNIGSELRCGVTPNGAKNCQFTIASNNRPIPGRQQEKPAWVRVTVWGENTRGVIELAKMNILVPGKKFVAHGELNVRYFIDKNTGHERMALEMNAQNVEPGANAPQEYYTGVYPDGTLANQKRAPQPFNDPMHQQVRGNPAFQNPQPQQAQRSVTWGQTPAPPPTYEEEVQFEEEVTQFEQAIAQATSENATQSLRDRVRAQRQADALNNV